MFGKAIAGFIITSIAILMATYGTFNEMDILIIACAPVLITGIIVFVLGVPEVLDFVFRILKIETGSHKK